MISLLILIIVVLIVLALAIYAINYIPGLTQPFKNIIIILCILIAILIILQQSGLLAGRV